MSHLQDIAIQAAETIQTAHVNKQPSVKYDVAPSTAAETKRPVSIDRSPSTDVVSDADDADEDQIPVSALRQPPRRPQMPPLPDLRFEQSYLASIQEAKGWQGVAFITMRDQVLMPLLQGTAWTLAVAGWRHWNGAAKFSGQTVGARIRRWWWSVNDWKLPDSKLKDKELAEGAAQFYTGHANVGSD